MTVDEARALLLHLIDEHRAEVLKTHRGYERPDPGKLIREGLGHAARALNGAPPSGTLADTLEAWQRRLEDLKQRHRDHPVSDDGWDDEDGWILGGVGTVLRDLGALSQVVREHGDSLEAPKVEKLLRRSVPKR